MIYAIPVKSIRKTTDGRLVVPEGSHWRELLQDGMFYKIGGFVDLPSLVMSAEQSKPDPFGDAVRTAQEQRPTPAPTYTPDDFTAPDFDTDAAYRRAMGGEA